MDARSSSRLSAAMDSPVKPVADVTSAASPTLSPAAFNADMLGQMRQNLRNQLSTKQTPSLNTLHRAAERASNDAVSWILNAPAFDRTELSRRLELLHGAFYELYQQANIPAPLRSRRYLCETGLVISPEHCTGTIKDSKRVYAFVSAVDRALKKLGAGESGRVHIVYPACGPFAPLLLPLLSYYCQQGIYSPEQLCVSLVDIQPGAVQSLQYLVDSLGVRDFILDLVCANALEYQPREPVNMVVLEALQHGFSREGHLQLAQHFAAMLEPDGIFLPQNISVNAALAVGQREFVEQWQAVDGRPADSQSSDAFRVREQFLQERIDLGCILNVDLAMLRQMSAERQDEHTQLLSCGSVTIPRLDDSDRILILCTDITVLDGLQIGEYESGITHPLPDMQVCVNFTPRDTRPGDLLVRSGDRVQFYYCMNGLPGFLPIRLEAVDDALAVAP